MKPSSLLGHLLELLELVEQGLRQVPHPEPSDKILKTFYQERRYLGSHDRRFLSEVSFGLIRHRRLCEAILERYLIEHPSDEELTKPRYRFLSLYGIYSAALVSNLIPSDDPLHMQHLLPYESYWKTFFPSIDEEKFKQWIMKNYLLEFLPQDKTIQLGVRYSFQDWMVERWDRETGNEPEQLLKSLNEPAPTTLRVNLLHSTRENCRERLRSEEIETEPTRYSPHGLIAKKRFNVQASQSFKDGFFEIQDEGSQLVSLALNPQPGMLVIDGCAGAGGKSLHLSEMMQNTGELIAIDLDKKKLQELERRAFRNGITNLHTQIRGDLIPENLAGKADAVLVDAPCTGSGTIRRNPSLKWTIDESLVRTYHLQQLEILRFTSQFTKTGGRLLYATCSLFQEENDNVIAEFLGSDSQFELLPVGESLRAFGITSNEKTLTLYPQRSGTDGFFIALMQRK